METKGDVSEFNALVEKCVCSDKKDEQVSYLAMVIMKVMKNRYNKKKLQDFTGIPKIKELGIEDARIVLKILDDIYSDMARLLLDNLNFDICAIRKDTIEEMQFELKRKQEAKRAVEQGMQEWRPTRS